MITKLGMTTSWGLDRISYCRSCGSKYSLASPRFSIAIFWIFLVTFVFPNVYAACLRVEYLSGWPLQPLPNLQIFLQPCLSALPMVFNYHDHCGWQSSSIFTKFFIWCIYFLSPPLLAELRQCFLTFFLTTLLIFRISTSISTLNVKPNSSLSFLHLPRWVR